MNADNRKITLFCFPYGGGSAYSYRDFIKCLPDVFHPIPLELPGRGRRVKDPLLTDMAEMVEAMFVEIREHLKKPYAIFGHSMGAFLGALVADRIRTAGEPLPLHLFVSGSRGISLPAGRRDIHALPTEKFFDVIRGYDDLAEEILKDEGIKEFFEPILRADFRAFETYFHVARPPFSFPVTAMIGADEMISREEAEGWKRETEKEFTLLTFPGRHFFIFPNAQKIGEIMLKQIDNTLNCTRSHTSGHNANGQ